jgi:hypothetical protein
MSALLHPLRRSGGRRVHLRCILVPGHKWVRVAHEDGPSDRLRCTRCDKERELKTVIKGAWGPI